MKNHLTKILFLPSFELIVLLPILPQNKKFGKSNFPLRIKNISIKVMCSQALNY